jgi:mannitol/fructose-specific phosphotransferase system IIA component (Ntr-type)
MLLTPVNAGSEHLATLAALSRPLRDEAFVHRVRQAPDAAALHSLLAGA